MYLQRNRGIIVPTASVPVVVAVADLPRGGTITSELVTTRDYPKEMAPEGALARTEEAIDRTVMTPLVKGEPVLDGKLTKKGAGRGLAALVPKGMRAVTIRTPDVASGVGGFVMPGDKVDVLLTVSDQGGSNDETGGGSTTTLLQRVEILAVDQKIDAPAENKVDPKDLRSVTLLVTPRQANLLDLGQSKGTLYLSLRNEDDIDASEVMPVTLADLRIRREKEKEKEKPLDPLSIREKFDETMAKILAERAETASAKVDVNAPEPVPTVRIRTIRGTREGAVLIYPAEPGSGGR